MTEDRRPGDEDGVQGAESPFLAIEAEGSEMEAGRPAEATIDLDALRSNFALARSRAEGREVIAVVKADAYGHGATTIASNLVEAGCERLAVVTIDEAAELRAGGLERVPILVLGGLHSDEEGDFAIRLGLVVTPSITPQAA
jgi:alanine racemase